MKVLEEILAISGKPGLYKMIAQSRNGLIAESLLDGKRTPVSASQQVSSLNDIAIYTYTEELPLAEVFEKIHNRDQGLSVPTKKSTGEELKAFFLEILPDYDQERVYTSDIKKVASWYTLLLEAGILSFEEDKTETDEPADPKEEPSDES
jgi:hypothetical protein